ncbi:MAG TPA: hypothetical protein VLG16_04095 [Candidatus Saccharimonadales bacterium]|nr:hypothetical protein [Candidatus Saccharimonadales bacterium]
MRKIRKATANGGESYSFAETYGHYPIIEEPPKPLAKPRENRQLRVPGEAVASAGIFAAIIGGGAVTGHFLGSHTSEIARGKVTTVQECVAAVGHQNIITQALDNCMEKGVPGGDPIGADKMAVSDPITSVSDYIALQEGSAVHSENDDTISGAAASAVGFVIVGGALVALALPLEAAINNKRQNNKP